ncbi:hypothetical protein KUTeg_005956 [Tegillarca granosa]|uniref:C2 domain-containing protein n=1 Tax=Tegillarca granosa TaxID=220873 RepID=A0ABQ9FJ37_TEGGR|nr:hypothetical protein KUTeg_005956 [Tegillarca granosa]
MLYLLVHKSDPSDLVDIEVVEEVIRNSICLASADFNITRWIKGGSSGHAIVSSAIPFQEQPSPKPGLPRPEAVFEPIEAKQQQSAFHSPGLASVPRPSRPTPGEKRLLVKVIKASGLGARQAGSVDPGCIVFMDMPPQSQTTSTVRSTINPFWDEQFLFDVNSNTTQLKFEVVDKRKPSGSNFLGEAIVYYDDLKKNPSSRQIIPLQGSGDNVSGSITVEPWMTPKQP